MPSGSCSALPSGWVFAVKAAAPVLSKELAPHRSPQAARGILYSETSLDHKDPSEGGPDMGRVTGALVSGSAASRLARGAQQVVLCLSLAILAAGL